MACGAFFRVVHSPRRGHPMSIHIHHMLHRSIVSPILVAFVLACWGKEIPAPSTITNAKVFLSGAEVTRFAKLGLPIGNTTLVFTRLS